MNDALPYLSVSDLIRKAYRIYRKRPGFFIGTSIIGPLLAATYPFLFWLYRSDAGARQQSTLSWLPMIFGTLVATTLMLLGSMFSSGAVVRSVAEMRSGEHTLPAQRRSLRMWSVIGIVFSVLLRMFGTGALFAIIGAGVLAVAAALGFNSPAVAGAIGFAVAGGWLLAIVLSSINIFARYAVAIQCCVQEGIGRRLALKRSALLTTGDRDRISILYSGFMVLSCAIVFSEFMLLAHTRGIAMWIAGLAAALLAGAVMAPMWTIEIALIYCDEGQQAATCVSAD